MFQSFFYILLGWLLRLKRCFSSSEHILILLKTGIWFPFTTSCSTHSSVTLALGDLIRCFGLCRLLVHLKHNSSYIHSSKYVFWFEYGAERLLNCQHIPILFLFPLGKGFVICKSLQTYRESIPSWPLNLFLLFSPNYVYYISVPCSEVNKELNDRKMFHSVILSWWRTISFCDLFQSKSVEL